MATVSRTVNYITQWMRLFSYERDIQQEISYNKHAFRKRLFVTATLRRVNEAYSEMYVWSVLCERNKIQRKTFLRKEMYHVA
jgi:hypothetical protein